MTPTALLAFSYLSTSASQNTLATHLTSASRSYYSTPESLLSTYTFFPLTTRKGGMYAALTPNFPAPPPKLPKSIKSGSASAVDPKGVTAPAPTEGDLEPRLVIGELQIMSSKEALNRQTSQLWFKEFQAKGKQEKWFDESKAGGKGEEVSLWDVRGGFVSRGGRQSGRKGNLVVEAVFECKDSGSNLEECAKVLSDFASWVQKNEPGTLSYLLLGRPARKKSNQLIMFERYDNLKSLGVHGGGKEFKGMFKKILPYIDPRKTKICEFEEGDDTFVGEFEDAQAKL